MTKLLLIQSGDIRRRTYFDKHFKYKIFMILTKKKRDSWRGKHGQDMRIKFGLNLF